MTPLLKKVGKAKAKAKAKATARATATATATAKAKANAGILHCVQNDGRGGARCVGLGAVGEWVV
jgi:hypothetical protein